MHRRVGDEHDWEQWLRGLQPYVAHDHHRCMVVHVEESESSWRVTQNDQKGVYEFQYLWEVEHVCPEKERPSWWGFIGDANDPMELRCVGEDGDNATKGHDEGDDEEDEAMYGWD